MLYMLIVIIGMLALGCMGVDRDNVRLDAAGNRVAIGVIVGVLVVLAFSIK